MGVVISFSGLAFAQGCGISGSVKDRSHNMSELDVMELSEKTTDRTIHGSAGGKAWSQEKPTETKQNLSWEKGAGKSCLIPALEIPAFNPAPQPV